MIGIMTNPPEHLAHYESHGKHKYFSLRMPNGELYGYAVVRKEENARFHFRPLKWSHRVLRQVIADFTDFKRLLKNQGHTGLTVAYYNGDDAENMYKLLSKFGFPEPKHLMVTGMKL